MSPTASLRHHFTVHAEPDPNVLARLVEPFVVHAVLPTRLAAGLDHAGVDYVVALEFAASADLAQRLGDRLEAMVPVRRVVRHRIEDAAAA